LRTTLNNENMMIKAWMFWVTGIIVIVTGLLAIWLPYPDIQNRFFITAIFSAVLTLIFVMIYSYSKY